MFAAAFVDTQSGRVTLVRDRMGMKPLYVYRHRDFVAFASEIRALRVWSLELDPRQAARFFHFGYLASPRTFYRDVTQICPGQIVELQHGDVTCESQFHDFSQLSWGSSQRADLNELGQRVDAAVSRRLVSDVPLGTFLSGGVDSALVASHLSVHQETTVPAFTLAFSESDHDESVAAYQTAEALGLKHETVLASTDQVEQLALDFFDCYEQPYADSSGLVTMLLCRSVKQHVTVALSGDVATSSLVVICAIAGSGKP